MRSIKELVAAYEREGNVKALLLIRESTALFCQTPGCDLRPETRRVLVEMGRETEETIDEAIKRMVSPK